MGAGLQKRKVIPTVFFLVEKKVQFARLQIIFQVGVGQDKD
jgi:hypothetical protein